MPLPLLGLFAGSVIAGVGLTLGNRVANNYILPWCSDVANNWNRFHREEPEIKRIEDDKKTPPSS